MQKQGFNWLAVVMLLPPVFIWAVILLRDAGYTLGDQLAAWLYAFVPEMLLLVIWVGFPGAAMALGLGGYVRGENKWFSAVVTGLSTALILLIYLGIRVLIP